MLMQIAANILRRKNNSASLPIKEQRLYFGRSQPELTYFSVPAIVYEGLGGAYCFSSPSRSTTVGI